MKLLILLLGYFILITFAKDNNKTPKYRKYVELAEHVNSVQSSWKASDDYAMALEVETLFTKHGACGNKNVSRLQVKKYSNEEYLDLPTNFDAREKWPTCKSIRHIRDQSECGSCWAFGSIEAMTDRICVAFNGTKNPTLSAAHLVACDQAKSFGCNGGYPEDAYNYYEMIGLVTGGDYKSNEGCWPYPFEQCEHHINKTTHYKPCPSKMYPTPECVEKCRDGYEVSFKKDKHHGKEAYKLWSVQDIQKDIYEHGPVTAIFMVYTDLFGYESGVYKHVGGTELGLHAIKILGWGKENGQEYWTIANSWNEDWGDNGFFKIAKGNNECSIESQVIGGLPQID